MNNFLYLGLFILALLSSCNREHGNLDGEKMPAQNNVELEKKEFVAWCTDKENNLIKTKELGDITFSILYKPAEYIGCMEESEAGDTNNIKQTINEVDGLEYYDFKIQLTSSQGELLKYNLTSASEYSERLNYFAFDMEKDIKLIEGQDTLSCALFHFERTYDVAPYATFLLAFPKSKSLSSQRVFMYQDKMFNKGIIKFTYLPNEISQIPKLKVI